MADKSDVFEQTLKHNGFFNFSDLYSHCYDWLKDQGYSIKEKEYSEKHSGESKEIQIEWEAGKGVSDYLKNTISLKWHIIGLKEAQAQRNGKTEKTNKGSLKIKVSATIVKDKESKWEDTQFWKFMRGIYDKYIIRTTIEQYEGKLKDKAESLVEDIKEFLTAEGKR